MIELPAPGPNEPIGQYISRLLANKIITAAQVPLAIQNYSKSKR
jgi:hypothetical protein